MIAAHPEKRFFAGIRSFYSAVIQYVVKKFPFNDDLLKHARFLNFLKRSSCRFLNVEYFSKHYKLVDVIRTVNDDLYDEFISYQLPCNNNIPSFVWESALVKQERDGQAHCRTDVIWECISDMKTGDGCNLKFPNLLPLQGLF